MMAAAEARAAWQRTANRCFVQEDAKRAPKLACVPSSSSSSKHADSTPANTADGGAEHPTLGYMPLKRNPSISNLPAETRWWLHLQPNYEHQKGFIHESPNTHLPDEDDCLFINEVVSVSETSLYKTPEVIKQQVKSIHDENSKEYSGIKESNDVWFDSDSPWLGAQKSEPWWRTADSDELASLVARKSRNQIENCDLPRPQNTRVRNIPFFDDVIFASSDTKSHMGVPNPMVRIHGNFASASPRGRNFVSDKDGYLKCGSDRPFSYKPTLEETTEARKITEGDPSKAEILEALRHCQTRAREAEKAAKQAYDEKKQFVNLFFRQASHIFAYKQLVKLLQIESFYIQLKNQDHPRKLRRNPRKTRKAKRSKNSRSRYNIGKYALAFALGLSLVGAGLLLGWTVGWMLPNL